MSKAKITLIGFYNYMRSVNDDLFKNLHTPTGIDKNILVNNILLKGGEFEVLYAEPYFYQNMIGVWSDKWQRTMEKWINALSIDYNPLENYDRMEDWTDDASRVANEQKAETATNASNSVNINNTNNNVESSEEHKNINSNIHSDSTVNDESASNIEATNKTENAIASDSSTSTGSGTTTNERSSFDSSTYSPHDKSTSSTSGTNASTAITNATGDTTTLNSSDTSGSSTTSGVINESSDGNSSNTSEGNQTNISQANASGDESRNTDVNAIDNSSSTHSGRMHGNIGVTTSQQMLEAELEISRFNLYDEIADLFLSELVIYLY